jgi:hypothetical protein
VLEAVDAGDGVFDVFADIFFDILGEAPTQVVTTAM